MSSFFFLSLNQFLDIDEVHATRPEKDHAAQVKALSELFKSYPEYRGSVRLVMVGGCRNVEDSARVDTLRALAKELGIQVSFV